MRIRLLASVAAIALLTIPGNLAGALPSIVPAAQAQGAEVSISVFYDGLRDHGRWVNHSRHKYVWVPVDVDRDWRPYSRGHWIYTERYGWYFASDEPFSWAVYHYGRWAFDTDIGWYWVPGRVWGPAWVTWRRGGDHLGWAPLPPEGDAVVVGVEISRQEPPRGYWVFVPASEFLAPDLTVVIVEREEIQVIYERTEFVGPVVVENDIVVNTTIDIDFIRETTGQEVQVTEVEVVQDPAAARQAGDAVVAVEGELAVEEGAAPEEAVEAEQVEAPTSAQQVEAASEAEPGQDGDAQDAQGEQPAQQGEQPAEAQESEQTAPEAETGAGTAGQAQPGDADQPAAESEAGEQDGEAADAEAGQDGEQPEPGQGAAGKQDRVPAGQPAEEAPATEESSQDDAGEAEESQQGGQPAQGQQQEPPVESQDQGEQPAQGEQQEQPAESQEQAGQPAQGEAQEQPSESQQGGQPAQGQQPSGECGDEDRAAGRCQ